MRFQPPRGLNLFSSRLWQDRQLSSAKRGRIRRRKIGVAVFEGTRPLSNINFSVTVMLPDGRQIVNFLPPTENNGISRILLEPIDLPKGTMVPYLVCVAGITDGQACLRESFLIWEE